MLRLTLMLSSAIYAGLVIYSEGAPDAPAEVATAPQIAPAPAAETPALMRQSDTMTLRTAEGVELLIAAVIDPADLTLEDATQVAAVTTVSVSEPEDTIIASASIAADLPLVSVTGSQVNLRAGPSTDDAVLGSLVRGTQAELVVSLGNGWAQIRAVDSGLEGFMAERFLAPAS